MESLKKLDFKTDIFRTICWIISVLSWILFILTGTFCYIIYIAKVNVIFVSFKNIWSFIDVYGFEENNEYPYFPIQLKPVFYILLFLILLLIAIAGFVIFLIKSLFKKDEYFYEGMMGIFSRYHFIPIICGIGLFIIGASYKLFVKPDSNGTISDLLNNINYNLVGFSCALVLSLIGLISLVFIKYVTELDTPFYVVYTIKDGFYSCLIPLFVYCVFYSSVYVGAFNKYKKGYKAAEKNMEEFPIELENMLESLPGFMNSCGIAFSIVIGVINLAIAFILKDILITVINIILYFGFLNYFYSISKTDREINHVSEAESVIDIIMLILSFNCLGIIAYNKFIKFFKKNKEEDGEKIN